MFLLMIRTWMHTVLINFTYLFPLIQNVSINMDYVWLYLASY